MSRVGKIFFCLDSAEDLDDMDYEDLDRYKSNLCDFTDVELDKEVEYWNKLLNE